MIIESYNTAKENELKIQANMDFTLATTIAMYNSCMMSKDAKQPKFEDLYGWLFKDDNNNNNKTVVVDGKEYKTYTKEEAQLELQKERFRQFAKLHNEQFNKENK